ncbi:hypothetical protein, partial [Treponema sp. R80B11-R83G3]
MNTSLLASIKWVISQHGESVLGNPSQLRKLIANHTKNEPKEERIAFGRCIEMGFYKELKKSRNIDERSKIKTELAFKLQIKTALNISLCKDALDILDIAIYGNTAPFLSMAMPFQYSKYRNIVRKIKNQVFIILKKPEIKWVSIGIAAIMVIAIIFNFFLKNNSNNLIDNRIEELKRITEQQEQIVEQLELIKQQIENGKNNNPNVQNTTKQHTQKEVLIENLQNDLLMKILTEKKEGRIDITGNIKVLVFPTNYRGNKFKEGLNSLTPIIQESINIINQQAKRYNQNIIIEWEYITLNNGAYLTINNNSEVLKQYNQYKNKYSNFNHIVCIYAIDKLERSYFTFTGKLGRSEEHAIIWFRDNNGFLSGTLAHEIFHAFGAEDLYYEKGVVPLEVEDNFKILLGNSIMINSQSTSGLDPINAWLIGWNKKPEPWYAWFIDKRDKSVDLG